MQDPQRVDEREARIGGGTSLVQVPRDPEDGFGKANQVPVRAEFDGEPYRGTKGDQFP